MKWPLCTQDLTLDIRVQWETSGVCGVHFPTALWWVDCKIVLQDTTASKNRLLDVKVNSSQLRTLKQYQGERTLETPSIFPSVLDIPYTTPPLCLTSHKNTVVKGYNLWLHYQVRLSPTWGSWSWSRCRFQLWKENRILMSVLYRIVQGQC